MFIGLTTEDADSLPEIEAFLEETGITWPNGYGAGETLAEFEMVGLPSLWVIGPGGEIVWSIRSSGSLEDAIETALAEAEPQ